MGTTRPRPRVCDVYQEGHPHRHLSCRPHPSPGGLPTQPTAVRARGISKSFGEVVALDGVDLDVSPGRSTAWSGRTAPGRRRCWACCSGWPGRRRRLEILGTPVARARLSDGVAGFVDGPGLYPSLTARQNLAALARLRGDGADGIDDALEQVGLTDVADDRVRGFSLGMRQRLGLAAALLRGRGCWCSTSRPTASTRPAPVTCTAC